MNVLIAIDSFKGSLTSQELSNVIESGINEVSEDFVVNKIPISDGGDGMYDALLFGLRGAKVKLRVKDPLFNEIDTEYGIINNETAIIEMASVSGLTLIAKEKRNPLNTTTYGVGQMIKDAIHKKCRNFIIGIGGSATNDGGIGMLSALGYKFYDNESNELAAIGSSLNTISKIDASHSIKHLDECSFRIACDVDNPLYGPKGAAHLYAKQKGASEEDILVLDQGLKNYSDLIKRDFGIDVSSLEGAGAAGGLGGGFKAFLNAELKPGIDIIFDLLKIEEKIKWADIVITGEGRLDYQTLMGKAPIGISNLAKKYNKTVIALAGSVSDDAIKMHNYGVTSMFSIMDSPMTLLNAMDWDNAKRLVRKKVVEVFRLIDSVI